MSSVAFDGPAHADSRCNQFSINSYRDKLVEAGAQGLVGKENADQLAQIIMRMCNGEVMEDLSRLRWPICVSAGG